MASVTISIDMDNEAFGEEPEQEVKRILERFTERLVRPVEGFSQIYLEAGESGPLRDINGAKVGSWTVEPD